MKFQCLGRSNWTTFSPLSSLCPIFPTFHNLYTGGPILTNIGLLRHYANTENRWISRACCPPTSLAASFLPSPPLPSAAIAHAPHIFLRRLFLILKQAPPSPLCKLGCATRRPQGEERTETGEEEPTTTAPPTRSGYSNNPTVTGP